MRRLSRDTIVALAVAAFALAALAVDHLVGTEEDPGQEAGAALDVGAFLLGSVVSLGVLAALFALVVRRARDADDAALKAMLASGVAVPALALVFAGLPFPFAAAGVALGLRGREGSRRRLATAAVALAAGVLLLVAVAYAAALLRT